MKKAVILTVMLVSVLALSFSQTALSGTYRYSTNAYITFTGNAFRGSWNRTTAMSGTYSVSGSRLTLNLTGGERAPNTWVWTIVDANTLRDQDGDRWNKENTGISSAGGSSFTFRGYPMNATSETITWFGSEGYRPNAAYANADQSPFHSWLKEMLGVNIKWDWPIAGTNSTQAINLVLASRNLPDVMFGGLMG
ncbi:MAG: hypothetical protein LBH43_17920, partial [Treponema sp.]|nr:hypothetical protein [Treponema sp.]